jgi:formylglycine-generating enzyme required for sulfatase activity
LPRGTVRNGAAILRVGDHITPQELSRLTFWPEAGFSGPAGSLRYTVDNGHGATVDGSLDVEVGTASAVGDPGPEAALWQTLRQSDDPREFEAFLRLFPSSRYVKDARRRRKELLDAAAGRSPAASGSDPPIAQVAAPANPGSEPEPSPKPPDKPAVAAAPPAAPVPVMTASNAPLVAGRSTPRAETGDFQDCPTCPHMIRIAGGSFTMGLGSHEPESQPAHHVDVRGFAIGKTPITVAEWKACMTAKACNFLPRMRVADDRTPVHNVSWEDVGQYVAWLSATSGHPYRLPSEAEWEYAARGGTATRYWWGDSVGMSLANCVDCGGAQDNYAPMPVDALRPNPYGLYDVLGGVAEWTADCWFPNYRGAPADATPRQAKDCEKRVLRGGSFRSTHDEITVTYRGEYDASVRYIVNGFRVARDLE